MNGEKRELMLSTEGRWKGPIHSMQSDFQFLFNQPIIIRDYSRLGQVPQRPPRENFGNYWSSIFYRSGALPVDQSTASRHLIGSQTPCNFILLCLVFGTMKAMVSFGPNSNIISVKRLFIRS